MTTSDLLSAMYAPPLSALKAQSTTLMQKLHTSYASATTETSAPSAHSSSGFEPTSSSWSDPYLHRVYWLMTNPDGYYLAGICGTVLQWVASPDEVPPELRFTDYYSVKNRWLAIRSWVQMDDEGLAIQPVDFYAHRSTPHLWAAAND